MKQDIWAIVLAAGKSTRMKQQKLLLPFGDKTIIRTVVNKAVHAVNDNVVVVLGAQCEEIRREAGNTNLKYCINGNYEEGMLSSVICGFNALPSEAAAALIILGDQPQIPDYVPVDVINAWRRSEKGMVIPVFKGKRGHPVLIDTKYAKTIIQLDGSKGLRSLMEQYNSDIYELECPTAEILRDIDTPADYQMEINKIK